MSGYLSFVLKHNWSHLWTSAMFCGSNNENNFQILPLLLCISLSNTFEGFVWLDKKQFIMIFFSEISKHWEGRAKIDHIGIGIVNCSKEKFSYVLTPLCNFHFMKLKSHFTPGLDLFWFTQEIEIYVENTTLQKRTFGNIYFN